MKVLHLVDTLARGGTQSILKSLLERGRSDGDVHLFALRSTPDPLLIDHPNVRVHPSCKRFSLAPMRELRAYVSAHHIDVLHCHLFRSQVFGFLLKTFFFPHIALIFHEHGRIVGREGEPLFEALAFRTFLRIAASSVDHFICISELTRDALFRCTARARARAVVIQNPLPMDEPSPLSLSRYEAKLRLRVPDDRFTVGFAGRLVRRKGWMDFLDAMQMVATHHDAYFLIAGEGRERALVKQHINSLGLQDRGRLLGQVSAMGDFYRALDCFVMSSRWEPHGLTQLEAQRAGVPVVVSNVPGLRDTVRDGIDALLFEPGNALDLAEKIERIAHDGKLRAALSNGGYANANRFSIEDFEEAVTRVYELVCNLQARPVSG
jgi:glycosyltransferase involved in cell wall biosynthesis